MTDIGIIYNKNLVYPKYPFNPDKSYFEIKYDFIPQPNNSIFAEMRDLLIKMGFDKENQNSRNWNPLGVIIKPGDYVLIKPNLIIDNTKHTYSVITHPSIIRFLIDYAFIATGHTGKIVVADAPQMNANIENIFRLTKIDKLISFLKEKGIPVDFFDLRAESTKSGWIERSKLRGDPAGYKIIDLKKQSILYDLEKEQKANFYGADFNRKIVNYNHNIYRNAYAISNTLLNSDVVISVPKLKTHKKAGVTLNLKNFIGINVHKNYLPHYRIGCPKQKGDSFQNMNSFLNCSRFLLYLFRDVFLSNYRSRLGRIFFKKLNLRSYFESLIIKLFFQRFYNQYYYMIDGDWNGNDTIWRTILDLNIIVRYADKSGNIKSVPQRQIFSIIDGIIGGDKDGPLKPGEIKAGVIIMSKNHVLADLLATKIMGFDYKKIPLLKNIFFYKIFPILEDDLNKIRIISNHEDLNNKTYEELKLNLKFTPPIGWETTVYNINKFR